MKRKLLSLAAIAATLLCLASCDKDNKKDEPKGEDIPEAGFGFFVNEDGSVIVEGDDGVKRINSIMTAIETYADKEIETTEGKKTVKCSNEFILPRGSFYYVNTNFNVKSKVTIRAAEGKGEMPTIQRLYDETGELPDNIMILYADTKLQGLHITSEEGTDGSTVSSTGFRVKEAGIKVTIDGCLVECFRKTVLRCDSSNNEFIFKNSVFRNGGNITGINEGRILDTRGNNQKSIVWENNYFYHTQGQTLRDGGTAEIDNIEIRNNTFYCIGNVPDFAKPRTVVIENNIYANVGWKDESDATIADEFNRVVTSFWRFIEVADDDIANIKSITIRNNNVFETSEQKALVAKYKEAAECTGLDVQGEKIQKAGKLTLSNNFEEVLSFDNPAPQSIDFIEVLYANLDNSKDNPALFEKVQFFFTGKNYTYGYPSTAKSAKASTTGGKIGATLSF